MDLLGEVEENLRALSVEARKSKQLSGVKEAAERGTLKCRSLKEGYAGYLRQKRKQEEESGESGAKGASTGDQWTGFQCPDLLQPFLLVSELSYTLGWGGGEWTIPHLVNTTIEVLKRISHSKFLFSYN
jgi:hypothetical protein